MVAKNMTLFLFLITVSSVAFMPQMMADTSVPAIYVFGDSTADVGNNNYLFPGNDKAKANYPHNGIDYPRGTSTGRFSNGYNGVDFLAKMMGFEESPPPVLSIRNQQTVQSVSFASGGSGILNATGQNYSLSMNTQIAYFEDFIKNNLIPQLGENAAYRFISKSIFVVSTGNSDMFGFAATSGLQNTTQSEQFITLLSSQFKDQLKRLYELRARKFAVLGTSHIGCVPFLRNTNPSGSCIEELNDLAQKFNNATKAHLEDLSSTMDGMKYSFVDAYEMISIVKEKPIQYGFKEMERACCGTGNFNGATGCIPNATYCSNREEYFFWDWFHPTQASYKLVAEESYNDDPHKFATPINIKELALI